MVAYGQKLKLEFLYQEKGEWKQSTEIVLGNRSLVRVNLFVKIQPLKLSHNKHTSEISAIHSLPSLKMSGILAVSYTNHYIGHRPILNNPTRTSSFNLFIPLLNC